MYFSQRIKFYLSVQKNVDRTIIQTYEFIAVWRHLNNFMVNSSTKFILKNYLCFNICSGQYRTLFLLDQSGGLLSCPQLGLWAYCLNTQIAIFMGPTWAHLSHVGPTWAACWPHKPCCQGKYKFQQLHSSIIKHGANKTNHFNVPFFTCVVYNPLYVSYIWFK